MHEIPSSFHGKIQIDDEFPNAFSFELQCFMNNGESEVIAYLSGFLLELYFYPDDENDFNVEYLDSRSGHAGRALDTLHQAPELVDTIIKNKEEYGRFVYLERVYVEPKYRSKGIALSLMRETKNYFAEPGTLSITTAYPDGENVTLAQRLNLASYYMSDNSIGFTSISKTQYPGILIASWDDVIDGQNSTATWEDDELKAFYHVEK